jgi:autotransporter-associated beta strand protein
MKNRILSQSRRLPGILTRSIAALLFGSCALPAATLTWDIVPGTATGDGLITGGTGVWDLAALNWTTNGGANNLAWNNATTNDAIFGGTVGTVTLGTGITVGNMTFNTAGYFIMGDTLTLAGATPTFTVNADANVHSALAGSNGFTKAGTGILIISGTSPNTYSGLVTVAGGELVLNKPANGGLTGDVVVNAGATLSLGVDHQLADAGIVTVNGTLNMGGHADIIGGLSGSGALTNLNSNSGELAIAPSAGGTFTFAGSLAGTGTGASANSTLLRIVGAGTQVFTGTVNIPNGTIAISLNPGIGISFQGNAVATVKGVGLGLAAFGADGQLEVRDNAVLTIGSSGIGVGTGNVGTIVGGGTGQAKLAASAAGTWAGPILMGNGTIGAPIVDTGANAVTISGTVSGSGFIKQGNGVLTLTDKTTLSNITIAQGSITFLTGFDQRDALGPSGTLTIQAGATAILGNNNASGPGVNNFNIDHTINILGGTLNVLDRTDIGLIAMTAGEIKGSAGVGNPGRLWIRDQGFLINASATTAIIGTGSLGIAALNAPFNVSDGAAEPDVRVTSVITQNVAGNGITKAGNGSMVLTAANLYTGPTFINAGRMTLAAGSSLSNTAITVAAGATFQTASGTFAGTTVAGTAGATLTLNAGSIFDLTGDNAVGAFSLNQNASFAANALALDSAKLKFDLSSAGADRLAVTKAGTYAGTNEIDVVGLGSFLFNGAYDVITANAFTSAGGTFQFVGGLATKNLTLGATTYTLSLQTTGVSQQIVVSGGFDPLATAYWKGNASGVWNALSPTNWATDAAGTPANIYPSAATNVVFSTTGGGANLNTTLGENFSVQSLTFSADADAAHAVTIGGTHAFRMGAGGLNVAAGSGAHTVNTSGGVVLGASQTWTNNSTAPLLVSSVIANPAGGTSNLTVSGNGRIILAGNNTYASTTIDATATLQIGNGGTTGSLGTGAVTVNGNLTFNRSDAVTIATLFAGGGTITKIGNGSVTLTGGSAASNLVLSSGSITFLTGFDQRDALNPTGTMTINAGATAILGNNNVNGPGVNNFGINNTINILGGTLNVIDRTDIGLIAMTGGEIQGSPGVGNPGRLWIRDQGFLINPSATTAAIGTGSLGVAALNAPFNVSNGAAEPDVRVTSVITQNVPGNGITKLGNGSMLLTAANLYTGPTFINAGRMTLAGSASLSNTVITVASGATLQVAAGAFAGTTAAGTLGATLTLNNGSILDLSGDNTIGTFSLNQNSGFAGNALALDNATLRFDLNAAGVDRLAVSTSGTFSGTNTIDLVQTGSLLFDGVYDLVSTSALTAIGGGTFQFLGGGTSKSLILGPITYQLNLQTTGTAQQLTITGGPTPIATGYWKGSASGAWNATGTTNWATDAAGTAALIFPSANTDVYFSVTGGGGNLNTTLGENFAIRSLTFTDEANAAHAVTIGGTHTLSIGFGGLTVYAGSGAHTISTTGGVMLSAAQTWMSDSPAPLLVTGPVGGSDLTVSGSGKFIFAGNNSYGATTVNAGATLQFGNGGTTGTPGVGAITNFGTIIFNRSDATTLAATITGGGAIIKSGAGTLTYTGGSGSVNMTLDGGTTIFLTGFDTRDAIGAGGTLTVNAGAVAQLGDGTTGPGVNNFSDDRQFNVIGGTIDVRDRTDIGLISMTGGTITGAAGVGVAGRLWIRTAGFHTSAAPATATISTGNLMLVTATNFDIEDGPASPDLTVSSVIQQLTAGLGFSKNGAGTLRLAGVNTYTGGTFIFGGTLDVALGGSISGSTTEVNNSGTLAGLGTVGLVNLLPSGTLAPGSNGIGTLNTGAINALETGILRIEVGATTADQVNVTGIFTLAGNVALNIALTADPLDQTVFTIVNTSGGIAGYDVGGRFSYLGTPLAEGDKFTVTDGVLSQQFAISYSAEGGTDVTLRAVPEPGSAALLLGGLSVLAFRRRKATRG